MIHRQPQQLKEREHNMSTAKDLRLQQRARMLKAGIERPKVQLSKQESKKASKDSIFFTSQTYNGGFVEA